MDPMSRFTEYLDIRFDGKPKRVKPLLYAELLNIPQEVVVCGLCDGHAQYGDGACSMCRGAQFVYTATAQPVPRSVRNQIESTNPGLVTSREWASYRVLVDYGGRLFHMEDIPSPATTA
jgi:hypothetical protein